MSEDIVARLRDNFPEVRRDYVTETYKRDRAEAAAEIERLRSLIDCAAKYWLDHFLTNPAIAWEGGIDKAMKAACGEIERLRAENAKLREAIANYESEQSNPVKDYTMVLRRRTELFAALAPKVSL